ncbi:MAG: methylase involved in ubiquinone/menaquinone biosynthesis [uncultured archaeon A07HN63]|nr:MAG: methylase involved in ubiquinone/menaquinone biosynthesis [uncultured archaeon A07HN63]
MTADDESDRRAERVDGGSGDSVTRAAGEVQAVYDRIADHFAKTREYAWPEVEAFVDDEVDRRGLDRALDIGCGNARHAELLAEQGAAVVGVDVSRELLGAAQKRRQERGFAADFVHGDAAGLPFAANSFSQVVYVATLHHLRPAATRQRSLAAVGRVLEPGGRALVSAWSTAHDRFDRDSAFETEIEWTLPGGETVDRYYYIYDPDTFRDTLAAVPEIDCLSMRVSSGNCYAVVAPADDTESSTADSD